jgi:hypothetical protein
MAKQFSMKQFDIKAVQTEATKSAQRVLNAGVGGSVELAVLSDAGLTERQKQTLLDVYASFISLNDGLNDASADQTSA